MSKKKQHDRSFEREIEGDDADVTSLPPAGTSDQSRRKRRRMPVFTLSVLLVLAVLVLAAPTIISLTPLGPRLVESTAKDMLNGSLTVRSVGLGWTSGVSLHGLTLKDKAGTEIAAVGSVKLEKSLLSLIFNAAQLGSITIDNAKLVLVARHDGSNLEDVLQPLMSAPSSGGATPECLITITNAAVKLIDGSTQESWEITPLAAQVASPQGTEKAWLMKVDAKVNNGTLLAEAAHAMGAEGYSKARLDAKQFTLDPLQPILSRLLGPTQLRGELTGKVECELADNGKRQRLQCDGVEAQRLMLASPLYLGADRLQIEQCRANGSAECVGGVWQLRDILVESDVAAVSGSGDLRVSDFASGGAVPQTDCDVRGVVDLAKLSRMLPGTMRVRSGVDIQSGRVNVQLVSKAVSEGRRFEAVLDTQDLRAINAGKVVELREPLKLDAACTQTSQGWRIDKIDAKSSFFTADASGSPEEGRLTLNADLSRLAEELDQFVDLGAMKLAGKVDGVIGWKRNAQNRYSSSGNLRMTHFELASPGMMPWRENDLSVNFQGSDLESRNGSYGIGGGDLQVASEKDRLNLTLRQGVASVNTESPLPVDFELRGDLATWLPRLQAFVPLAGWKVAGPVLLTAQANVSMARVEVPKASLQIENLAADGMGLHIHEQVLQGATQFLYEVQTGTLTTSATTLQSTTFSLLAEKLIVQTGSQARITGEIAGRGDVGKILGWLNDPSSPVNYRFVGEMEAGASFAHQGGVTRATLHGEVVNLAYAERASRQAAGLRPGMQASNSNGTGWQNVWEEPKVTFGGEAAYDAGKDMLNLNKMQAQAGTTAVSATGAISQLATRCQLDLTGDLKYDLATWAPKVRPMLGPTFEMVGSATRNYEIHGPLFTAGNLSPGEAASLLPKALTGKAGFNWEAAEWMALQMGVGDLTAELKQSVVTVQPMQVPMSQGFLNLSPAVVLQGPTWYVAQEQTKLLENVVITPEMCNTWIQYVAPPLANAAHAEGKFSVDLEKAVVPLNAPTACDMKGDFVVHSVTVGPGALAQSVLQAADQVKAFVDGKTGLEALGSLVTGGAAPLSPDQPQKQWMQLPEQKVAVEVVDGRVYHKGLTFQRKDIIVRTSGSVGIADQSLQLTAEVPILDAWIKDRAELQGLKGQVIQFPVTGSLTRPVPDLRGILNWGKSMAFTMGKGAIEGQINKGVEQGRNAVSQEVTKGQTKIQDEINKGKQKLESELRNGLKGIFGGS